MPRHPRRLPPLHPGEVLREEFMNPLGITAYKLAKACYVPRTRIERIVREEMGISADTALRLGRFFGTTPAFWLNLQSRFAIETTATEIADDLASIEARRSGEAVKAA